MDELLQRQETIIALLLSAIETRDDAPTGANPESDTFDPEPALEWLHLVLLEREEVLLSAVGEIDMPDFARPRTKHFDPLRAWPWFLSNLTRHRTSSGDLDNADDMEDDAEDDGGWYSDPDDLEIDSGWSTEPSNGNEED